MSKDEISIESPMPELKNIARVNHNEETNTDTKKKVSSSNVENPFYEIDETIVLI